MRRHPARFGIRTLIAALTIASLLPGLLAGGLVLWQFRAAEEQAEQTLILEVVRALSAAVDHDIGAIEAELRILAASDAMKSGDMPAVRARAAELASGIGESWITLRDLKGRLLFDTLAASGLPSSEQDDAGIIDQTAVKTGSAVSTTLLSTPSARRIVVARVPVPLEGETRFLLELKLPAEHFAVAVKKVAPPDGWLAVIVDKNGTLVTRWPSRRERAREESGLLSRIGETGEGAYVAAKFEGVLMNGAFTRSELSGWAVALAVPTRTMNAPFYKSVIELAGIAALLALLGMALAALLIRRMVRPIRSLSRAAEALGCGIEPLKPEGGIREIERVSEALLDSAELVKRRSAERDQALAALSNANDTLERRVHERTRELEEANRQLSHEIERRRQAEEALLQRRKLEAMGQLTAGVAHDFNNLLTAIIGNIGLLLRHLGDDRSRGLAERSLIAANRAATVTKQLLMFGRKQRLETRIVDINAFLSAAEPLMREAAGPAIAVEVHLAEGSGAVQIDTPQMQLALLHLVTNARDAMPGGGRIIVETRWLSVAADHPHVPKGEWAVIRVTDTGVGMMPEVAARAFEPFFTTKQVGAGTGLGLSMVHGLVKQLGGDVVIQSEPRAGTLVVIYLPRLQAAMPCATTESRPAATSRDRVVVLLVDDDPAVRAVMAASLREAGHTVVEAGGASAALDVFGAGAAFDAAIVDYAMPEMKGTSLIRVFLERRPSMPVLLVTGFAEAEELEHWPAHRILYKPFSPERLLQRVTELVRDRSADGSGQRP